MEEYRNSNRHQFAQHLAEDFYALFTTAKLTETPSPAQMDTLAAATEQALALLQHCTCSYHDAEHTMLVTRVGQLILKGRQQQYADVTCHDALQALVALLFHDVGYIRQLLPQDNSTSCVTDPKGTTIEVPATASDAIMTPYHVQRGMMFIAENFAANSTVDITKVQAHIQMTLFPVPKLSKFQTTDTPSAWVRGADLIGQIADPNYRNKLPSLYAEFVEFGEAQRQGYTHANDLWSNFAGFYAAKVQPYIQPSLSYLDATPQGRQWTVRLHRLIAEAQQGTS
jgi:hypothetical protein